MLAVALTASSCEKDESDTIDSGYEGDLFKIEKWSRSMYTYGVESIQATEEWSVVGGNILLVGKDYMVVSIREYSLYS